MNVFAAGCSRHVPFGDIADALWIFQEWRGNQGYVAKRGAAEIRDHGSPGGIRLSYGRGNRLQVGVSHRLELFQVVLRVEFLLPDRFLPDDCVEEIAVRRHAPARRSP